MLSALAADDVLNSTFAALADPTRRAILSRLSQGDAPVLELAEPFSLSQPAISKHLKVLENAGLIRRNRVAQQRICQLRPERLKEAADWLENYRKMAEASYQRLENYLQDLQNKDTQDE